MTLPADVSRCTGWWQPDRPGHSAPHPICMNCARRTAKPEERQSYVLPPEPVEGCRYWLAEAP
jgi:hypothetical protein